MSYEKTSGYPLEDGHSDIVSESKSSLFILLEWLSLLDGLEEEGGE